MVVELGANDGLRGLDAGADARQPRPDHPRRARRRAPRAAARHAHAAELRRRATRSDFEQNYVELAQQHRTAFLPFLLAPIAADRNNFQADNLHPGRRGAAEAARPRLAGARCRCCS